MFSVTLTTFFLIGFTVIPVSAFLDSGKYNCNTGELELDQDVISGYFTIGVANDVIAHNVCTDAVIIPSGVRSIGNNAFIGNTALTSVVIPFGVISIGENAFYENYLLTSVVIPDSVTSIGDNAFTNNFSLESVVIGNSVLTIGDGAFSDNTLLASITIGNSVTRIGYGAFVRNTALTEVIIPASVTSIGDVAFWHDSALTSVTFLGHAPLTENVGDNAFFKGEEANKARANVAIGETSFGLHGSTWKGLRVSEPGEPCYTVALGVLTDASYCGGDFIIPDSVTSIGDEAFKYDTSLTSVTIGSSVAIIGDYAFYGNTALTSVSIGNSVTSIGTSAFQGNTALTSVTIPDSVTSIGTYAFYVTGLTSVTFSGTPNLTSIGQGVLSNTALTSIIIPNSVTSIGEGAFYFDTELTSVTIGNSVTSIADNAFGASTKLTSVEFLGDAPPTVGVNVFSGVAVGAIANVAYNATGFGSTWNGLIVRYASAPAGDSGSSSPTTVVTITPEDVRTADAVFNLKNRKYLSKNAMKIKLRKNMEFERDPEDSFKYSIFKASKKTCIMRGNYVMGLKKSGSCDLYATRTTPKGAKYKYWVKINYSN